MATILSETDYSALLQESVDSQMITPDQFELVWRYPLCLGQGWVRDITLREGIDLSIVNYQLHDDLVVDFSDREHPVEYVFYLSNCQRNLSQTVSYCLCGSGISPGEQWQRFRQEHSMWVSVHIEPEVFRSYVGIPDGQVPEAIQHLIGDAAQEYYVRSSQATPMMHSVLQQILDCPYQGYIQRLFMEAKVLELLTLLLDHESEVRQGAQPMVRLRPDEIERLHWAKEILHQRLNNPPSLVQLARQVGLNECTLKRGFRQMFHTTIFGYLRQRRMEQAKVLLMQGRMNVREAAQAVGYASQSRFASAFRQTFGINPKAFSAQYWQ